MIALASGFTGLCAYDKLLWKCLSDQQLWCASIFFAHHRPRADTHCQVNIFASYLKSLIYKLELWSQFLFSNWHFTSVCNEALGLSQFPQDASGSHVRDRFLLLWDLWEGPLFFALRMWGIWESWQLLLWATIKDCLPCAAMQSRQYKMESTQLKYNLEEVAQQLKVSLVTVSKFSENFNKLLVSLVFDMISPRPDSANIHPMIVYLSIWNHINNSTKSILSILRRQKQAW